MWDFSFPVGGGGIGGHGGWPRPGWCVAHVAHVALREGLVITSVSGFGDSSLLA